MVAWIAAWIAACTSPAGDSSRAPTEDALTAQSADARMDWWRDARFGLFIHWGLYAIPAGTWGERTDHGEWIYDTAQVPIEQYERLRERFDPVKFDADAWADLAARAGMQYVVITTKHHDGFCLFDSKLTDYDVMSTPFRRDVMRELADACRRRGLRIGWYHSIMDWHHPDYLPRRGWESRGSQGARFDRYVEHLKGQVSELLSNYGPIGVMWFDGEWEHTWTSELGEALYAHARRLQPSVIVNNRVGKSREGMSGMNAPGAHAGDFGTPEQEVPARGFPGVDWESCMTMNDHWGFNAHDSHWKSADELVRTLVDVASKGGNFLLNVGPTAEGEIPRESVERLLAIGEWTSANGEAIHGTRAGPFASLPWGRATMRARGDTTRLYLCVYDWPSDGALRVDGLANEIVSARFLGHETTELAVAAEEAAVRIDVPRERPDSIVPVIALDVRGAPVVYDAPTIAAPSQEFVDDVAVELSAERADAEIRYTLDGSAPSSSSSRYSAPVAVHDTATLRARSFVNGRAVSGEATASFRRVAPSAAVAVDGARPGVRCEKFFGVFDAMPSFDPLARFAEERATNVSLGRRREPYVARRLSGYLTVPKDELYVFALTSDDGSRLWIDGTLVVDCDGLHVAVEKRGTIALARGAHAIRVEHFNKTGDEALALAMAPLGEALVPIPDAAFSSP